MGRWVQPGVPNARLPTHERSMGNFKFIRAWAGGSGAPSVPEKAQSDIFTGAVKGEMLDYHKKQKRQRIHSIQKGIDEPHLVLANISSLEAAPKMEETVHGRSRTWVNWAFGAWIAKYHRKETAEEVKNLFVDEVYEDEETLKKEGLSVLPKLTHDETTTVRKIVTKRIQGTNYHIRRRARLRVGARITILRRLTEELKFRSSVKTKSAADLAYLEHQARTLIKNWCDDKCDGYQVVEKSRNFFLEGLTSLYWVKTEDDVLWDDVRASADEHLSGFD